VNKRISGSQEPEISGETRNSCPRLRVAMSFGTWP
jgi:hypothetical protein